MEQKIKDLEEAKKNVIWLLENPNGSIDMHSMVYWAGVVETLREEIKNSL